MAMGPGGTETSIYKVRSERVFWWGQGGRVGFSVELPGISDFAVTMVKKLASVTW